jgi:hypothetical protein
LRKCRLIPQHLLAEAASGSSILASRLSFQCPVCMCAPWGSVGWFLNICWLRRHQEAIFWLPGYHFSARFVCARLQEVSADSSSSAGWGGIRKLYSSVQVIISVPGLYVRAFRKCRPIP